MEDERDEIVLTPLQSVRGKVIRIARVPKILLEDAVVQHIAGGPYKGIVINKQANEKPDPGPPETERSFTAIIGDQSKSREWREVRFWFQPDTRVLPQVRDAITETFFKELMDPVNFPKDYISFLKKLLMLVRQYSAILRIELEIRPLNPNESGPTTIRRERKQIVRASVIGGQGVQNGSGPKKQQVTMLEEDPPVEVSTSGSTGGRGGNPGYEASLKGTSKKTQSPLSPYYSYNTAKLLASDDDTDEPLSRAQAAPTGGGKGSHSYEAKLRKKPQQPDSRSSVMHGARKSFIMAGQVPSQEDIKVLLYSEAVTQEQLEETLFAAGFMRSAPSGGVVFKKPGLVIHEDIQVIIRQEINAGNDLEQSLYNAGYVPRPGKGDELFKAPGRSQEDIQRMLYKETIPIDELNTALAEAGFMRAPTAVYMAPPGVRGQEDLKSVLIQETANGLELEQALYMAGYVPSASAGPQLFNKPGRSQEDFSQMLVKDTVNVDDLNVALAEAGFVKAPTVGVVLRYPGAKGQEDLKQVLQKEVAGGMELEQALHTAGFIPNPKNDEKVFAQPRRSQEDIQQMLVKETMTFDQLNCALSEAGYVMAPGIGATLKYPGLDPKNDVQVILSKEVEKGVEVEQALWTAGYVPNPESSAPAFSAPGRSEDDIKQMLYKTELNVTLLNSALAEAGFVRSYNISTVVVQPGARAHEDLRVVLREETRDGTPMQEALFVTGYVPKPEMADRLFKAVGYSEDDLKALLQKRDVTEEELEVAIYEAGFYRPPGLGAANRPQMQEDVRFLINREMEKGATLEEALYKTGYVKNPTKGVTVKRAPTISRKGWEMLWASKKNRLLQILEDAYPNVMSTENLIKVSEMKRNNIERLLHELLASKSIQELSPGNWMIVHAIPAPPPTQPKQDHQPRTQSMIARGESSSSEDEQDVLTPEQEARRRHEIKMVAHIPHLPKNEQPTIAVITLLFCEKLAVDAMMHTRTTYIRYKVEGEGQVYTVGKIGKHRVVATKLSRIGLKQDAMIAAGNAITRMLGTFSEIEHVFLVGVGGGVREDGSSTLRLGDIVTTRPRTGPAGPIYIHCAESEIGEDGRAKFMTQSWKPNETTLQKIIDDLERDPRLGDDWSGYQTEALAELSAGQTSFLRPGPETDKFYKPGEEDQETSVHYGIVGSGKGLGKDDELRRQFAIENECLIIDSGFQAVMQSIEGNRKDTFAVIRGVSDYHDGTQRREWQPYAALVAAAYWKTLVLQLPVEEQSDSD